MKYLFLAIALSCLIACSNESNSNQQETDTANRILLPENRSSDSPAITPVSPDTAGRGKDTTAIMQDSPR